MALTTQSIELKGLTFSYRKGMWDREILSHTVTNNAYGIGMHLNGQIVVDIGAHIGSVSVLAASYGANVFSFEPESSNFSLLLENTSSWKSISVFQKAVCGNGKRSRTLCLHSNNSGCHSLSPTDWTEQDRESSKETQTVDITTIREIFDKHRIDRCALLKMDCEGSEVGILLDILDPRLALLPGIDSMAIEFHSMADSTWAVSSLQRWFQPIQLSTTEYMFVKFSPKEPARAA